MYIDFIFKLLCSFKIPTSHRWPSQPPANLEQLPFLSTVPLKQEEAMKSEDSPENMGNQPAMSIEEAGDTQVIYKPLKK